MVYFKSVKVLTLKIITVTIKIKRRVLLSIHQQLFSVCALNVGMRDTKLSHNFWFKAAYILVMQQTRGKVITTKE